MTNTLDNTMPVTNDAHVPARKPRCAVLDLLNAMFDHWENGESMAQIITDTAHAVERIMDQLLDLIDSEAFSDHPELMEVYQQFQNPYSQVSSAMTDLRELFPSVRSDPDGRHPTLEWVLGANADDQPTTPTSEPDMAHVIAALNLQARVCQDLAASYAARLLSATQVAGSAAK